MKIAAYSLVILGTLIGGFILLNTMIAANGAPQEAAGAAMAIAFAVLPYCFARAIEKMGQTSNVPSAPAKTAHYAGLSAPQKPSSSA